MKPILRWAGSKAQILGTLQAFWKDDFRRYIEPFCGSASLFYAIAPRSALLSDLNAELITAMQQIQLSPSKIVECISRYPVSESDYYRVRRINPADLAPVEQAARFIYLNALCFNGLYRTNKQGLFNVPYGTKHRHKTVDSITLYKASALMSDVRLKCCDFEDTVKLAMKGDFLYLDPPYATNEKRTFTEYNEKAFTHSDLDRLFNVVEAAASRGVKFVLSYANVAEVRDFGHRWHTVVVQARRNIAGFVDSRRTVEEVVVTNCR